jgi:hypothetical protein
MSSQITTSFVEQYSSNVGLLSQQLSSKLRSSVDVENIVGKNGFFEQLSATAAALRTSRHGDTPQIDEKIVDIKFGKLLETLFGDNQQPNYII